MLIRNKRQELARYAVILILIGLVAVLMKKIHIDFVEQAAGWINFSLGFVLLAAFAISHIVAAVGLPRLSGYIFAGVLAGPFVTGFLTLDMIERLRLIDGLALSFIALAAGAEMRFATIRQRGKALGIYILLISIVVFTAVWAFVFFFGQHFPIVEEFTGAQRMALAILLGGIAVTLSPASAIAIIDECESSGPFTENVLGVIIIADILIIIVFPVALAVSQQIAAGAGTLHWSLVAALVAEILISLLIGVILGKFISSYISRIGYDFILFLVFIAFAVARMSMAFNELMDAYTNLSLHLEPLLICISAGFFVRNFSLSGEFFMESLDRISLPVYVLFFSLAGAALNFESLLTCWMFAFILVIIRAAGLFCGSWLAGRVNGDPEAHNRSAWMTYVTQAGVSIGLAQIVVGELPRIGLYLNTVVLGVIAINQILGPILFKIALGHVGESRRPHLNGRKLT